MHASIWSRERCRNGPTGLTVVVTADCDIAKEKFGDAGLSGLRHVGKRFVFSMPDFVAGVQFDTVFLVEVNDGEINDGPYSTGALRQFVSTVYLGASRAERVLEIYSSEERGGPSRVLLQASNKGALNAIDIRDLQ